MLFTVDLSITNNMVFSILGLILNVICSQSLLGSTIFQVDNLSRAFRSCCSFCISPLMYNSFIKFDGTVGVSLFPDSFNPSKTSSLSQRSPMLDGKKIFTPSLCKSSHSSSFPTVGNGD